MARIQNPIIGRAKKHAGGMIFYKLWKHNIMRAMPVNVRVNNSELRLIQRSKFASVKLFASLIIQAIRFGFLVDQVKHSAFAAFMKANLPACLTGPFNMWPTLDTVTDANVNFGGAELPGLQSLGVTPSTGLLLNIGWSPDLVAPGTPTDNVAVLVYKQGSGGAKGKSYWTNLLTDPVTSTPTTRSVGIGLVTLSLPFVVGDVVNVVVFVYNATKYHAGSEFCSKFAFVPNLTLL